MIPIISSYRCYYYVVLFPTTPSSTWPVAGAARGWPARMKGNALMTLAVAWQGGTSKHQAASAHVEDSRALKAPAASLLISPLHLRLLWQLEPHSCGHTESYQPGPVLPRRLSFDRPMSLLDTFYCKAKSNDSRGRGGKYRFLQGDSH